MRITGASPSGWTILFHASHELGIGFAAATAAHQSPFPRTLSFAPESDGPYDRDDGANVSVGFSDDKYVMAIGGIPVHSADMPFMTVWFDEDQADGMDKSHYLVYACFGQYCKTRGSWVAPPHASCVSIWLDEGRMAVYSRFDAPFVVDAERMAWMEYECLNYHTHKSVSSVGLAKKARAISPL